jgi:predicted anti-sigma-YlaC factor YlaD
MYWIVALAVTLLGAAIHLSARAEPSSAEAIGRIGLLWFAGAFYGMAAFIRARYRLSGRASSRLDAAHGCSLWTFDRQLRSAAATLNILVCIFR